MKRPAYIDLGDREREEFLSQRGNFTPDERTIFRELAGSWEPRIDYDRFIKRVRETGGAALVKSLMSKLYQARVGILRTKVIDGERRPVSLLLLEEGGFDFYFEALQEAFVNLNDSIVNPLPLASRLTEQGLEVPEGYVTTVDNEALAGCFKEKREEERKILGLNSLNGAVLLLPNNNLRTFINIAILKIRYYMSNTSLLESMAKYQDTSLMAIKQNLGGKEPSFWLNLTSTIVDKRKELQSSRNVSIDKDFYHAAYLLRRLVTAQIEEAKERKQQQKERELDLETVAMTIKRSETPLLDQGEVNEIIDRSAEKYGDDRDSFREEFYERYVHAKGKRSLPKVVMVDSMYIHRDNFYPVFLERFQVVGSELRRHYKEKMETELKAGGAGGNPVFFSHENFENDIRDEVERRDSFVSAVLSKPAVLAEAVILNAKQRKQVKSLDDLKKQLSIYFNPESMKLLDLPTVFNLSLGEIYDDAFEKLHILRRIWVRLTGKYNAVRDKYVSRSVLRSTANRPGGTGVSVKEYSLRDRSEGPVDPGSGRKRESRSGGAGGESRKPQIQQVSRRRRTGQKQGETVKRPYSKKQQDSAWEAFGDTIKKKDD